MLLGMTPLFSSLRCVLTNSRDLNCTNPANVSSFESVLPFKGLTTHGTSQEQLLTNNSRCRQSLNTALCSPSGLFMLTFSNPFYCSGLFSHLKYKFAHLKYEF